MISVSQLIVFIKKLLLIIIGSVAIRKESNNGKILHRYHCIGNETFLHLCPNFTNSLSSNAENLYNRPRAAVECQQMNINLTSKILAHEPYRIIIHAVTCTMEGAIRLVNGSTEIEGRVEVCQDGYWGTVCSDSWSEEDAYVVCRQILGQNSLS